jgi:putative oxidoreductase
MTPLALDRYFLSRERAFQVARIGTACLFLAHAVVRVVNNTIPQFALFMGNQGFPQPTAVVWAITMVELIAALCLVVRFQVSFACAALASIAIGGIVLIHSKLGWFVGEHGTGGSEFSVALLLLLYLIAIDDRASRVMPRA